MLWVSTNISDFSEFREKFKTAHKTAHFLDLSKLLSSSLIDESISIVDHHSECTVFLGYLEPGWMLEATHQTVLRKLIRKFPVGMLCNYYESLPFSWKNEIEFVYT
jgi:hypothetical protein